MLYDYIFECDAAYPNTIPLSVKQEWLDRLEAKLDNMIAENFDSAPTECAAPYPYDEIYVAYLKMLCAERNGDTVRYNNYLAAFEAAKNELYAYLVREGVQKEGAKWKNVL